MPFSDLMPNIFYISPYALDFRYGMEINKHIECLPDDAWICLTDQDVLFLTPNVGRIVSNVIIEHGDDTDLFTCQTNRLGNPARCYANGLTAQDSDILNHIKIARKLEREHGHECVEVKDRIVAGMFMLFHKSVWQDNPFDEHTIIYEINHHLSSFDVRWTKGIKGSIKKILGIYVWHTYRMDGDARCTKHLEI
jgi:hypothetical protein